MIDNVEKAKNYAPEKTGRKEKRATVSGKINKRLISILFPALAVLIFVTCYIAALAVTNLSYQVTEGQTKNAVDTVDEFFNGKKSAVGILSYNEELRRLLEEAPTAEQIAGAPGKEAAVTLLERAYDTMAVSYTHLDVYKRQGTTRSSGCTAGQEAASRRRTSARRNMWE